MMKHSSPIINGWSFRLITSTLVPWFQHLPLKDVKRNPILTSCSLNIRCIMLIFWVSWMMIQFWAAVDIVDHVDLWYGNHNSNTSLIRPTEATTRYQSDLGPYHSTSVLIFLSMLEWRLTLEFRLFVCINDVLRFSMGKLANHDTICRLAWSPLLLGTRSIEIEF